MSTTPMPSPSRFGLWLCAIMIAIGTAWRVADGTFGGVHAVLAVACASVAVGAVIVMSKRKPDAAASGPAVPDLAPQQFENGFAVALGVTVLGVMTLAGAEPGWAEGLFAIAALGVLGFAMLKRAIGG